MAKPDPLAGSEFIAPTDPEKLVSWLDRKRTSGRSRVPDQSMRQNLAFTLGQQWIVWDAQNGRFKRPANHRGNPNAPVRITANKIAGLVERAVSKLTKDAPEPEARPVSDSEKDISTAKVATRILEHEMYRLGWDTLLSEFYFWPVILGWSHVHIYWDPKAGGIVGTVDDDDDPGAKVNVHKGDICIEQVPAFELSVDPNAMTMDDARWCVRTTTMSREAVWERWGVNPEGAEGGQSLADQVHSMTDDASTQPGRRGRNQSEFVKVHQFWQRPGARSNPKGMVATWAGKTILDEPRPFPYDHGKLPFPQASLLPGLGTREGRTWVSDLVPLQVDYNDARSREATIRRTLTPKVLTPTGSIDPRRVTSRVEIIEYAPTGGEPKYMIPDSGWMAQFEAGMQRADQEMGDRAGQQDVTAGKAPTASMPAAAILALQEADDTRMALSAKELASFIQTVGWHILQLVRQYWDEARVVRTWSDDGDLEVTKFMGSDVADALDIHVSSESSLPKSKAAQTQLTLDLVDRKILTDPRVIIRMLDMPGADFLSETLNKHAKKAHRENGELLEGEQCKVAPFDNHAIHIEEHTAEMLESWYDEAEPTDPRRIVFDAHLAAHQELMAPPAGTIGVPPAPGGGPLNAPAPPPPNGGAPAGSPQQVRKAAGIGGPGNPGQVPGVSPEQEAAAIGR